MNYRPLGERIDDLALPDRRAAMEFAVDEDDRMISVEQRAMMSPLLAGPRNSASRSAAPSLCGRVGPRKTSGTIGVI
jgi:hypothetical protein